MTVKEIEALRREINRIDNDLVELMARRDDAVTEIGLVKKKDGMRIRDQAREKEVLEKAAQRAESLGLDGAKVHEAFRLLISDSVRKQKATTAEGLKGKTALIVGGAGRMGAWTARFLSGRGAHVKVQDARGKLEGYENVETVAKHAKEADMVVMAGPLGTAPRDLKSVIEADPDGLVFDMFSIKSHVSPMLFEANERGVLITSVHPMFGPNAPSPRGRNVLICDCGNDDASKQAYQMFTSWGARAIMIELDEHDKLMAYVLGLSHLTALLFAETARRSHEPFAGLREVQGPTFERLSNMAKEVVGESRRVYHDIQAFNPNTPKMVASLEQVFSDLKKAALDADPNQFAKIMDADKEYLEAE